MALIQWLSAWLLFILILALLARTAAGKTIFYYLLWLAVILLLVTNYQQIADLFAAGGITSNATSP